MKNQERILMYWPKDKAIPKGWVLSATLQETHHGFYSIIIEKRE